MNPQQIMETLEQLVDASTLNVVVSCLAETCQAKSDHLLENWQDTDLARLWREAASALIKASLKIKDMGL